MVLDGEEISVIKSLDISERIYNEKKVYIVKNTISGKFYMFGETQYRLFTSLSKYKDIDKVISYMKNYNVALTEEKVLKFVNQLKKISLVDNNEEIQEKKKIIELPERKYFLQRLLFIKINMLNPDSFVTNLLNKIKFVYNPIIKSMLVLEVIIGLYIYLMNYAPWKVEIVSESLKDNFISFIFIYVITIFMSFFHELSHALACKKYGGEVKHIGVLILYFRLGLFCDISSSYMFKDKKQRINVSMAGIYFDFIAWSSFVIMAFILKINGINLKFMPPFLLVGIISIVLQINPLIKLDGYYVLTEVLGIYNLRKQSFDYLKNCLRNRRNEEKNESDVPKKNKIIFILYAVIAGGYSISIVIYTYYLLSRYLFLKLSSSGIIVAILILFILFYDVLFKIVDFGCNKIKNLLRKEKGA